MLRGLPQQESPGQPPGPQGSRDRLLPCGPPNSGRFAQTPCQPSEGGERPANSGAAAIRSPRRTELRGGGRGLRRCGLSQVHPGGPCPALFPGSAAPRATLAAPRGQALGGQYCPRAAHEPLAAERSSARLPCRHLISLTIRQLSRTQM